MNTVAFDTLRLAQRLEAAGLAPKLAQEVAGAVAESVGETGVTRDHLDLSFSDLRVEVDLRLGEIRSSLAELQGEFRLLLGAIALQTLAILGGVAVLLALMR